jgi:hypothetical protein
MEQQMNITRIISTEVSGFCDVATGECIVVDAASDADLTTPEDRSKPAAESDASREPAATS